MDCRHLHESLNSEIKFMHARLCHFEYWRLTPSGTTLSGHTNHLNSQNRTCTIADVGVIVRDVSRRLHTLCYTLSIFSVRFLWRGPWCSCGRTTHGLHVSNWQCGRLQLIIQREKILRRHVNDNPTTMG